MCHQIHNECVRSDIRIGLPCPRHLESRRMVSNGEITTIVVIRFWRLHIGSGFASEPLRKMAGGRFKNELSAILNCVKLETEIAANNFEFYNFAK